MAWTTSKNNLFMIFWKVSFSQKKFCKKVPLKISYTFYLKLLKYPFCAPISHPISETEVILPWMIKFLGNFAEIIHTLDNWHLNNPHHGNFTLGNPLEIRGYFTTGIPIPDNLALGNVTLSDSTWGNLTLGNSPWISFFYFYLFFFINEAEILTII